MTFGTLTSVVNFLVLGHVGPLLGSQRILSGLREVFLWVVGKLASPDGALKENAGRMAPCVRPTLSIISNVTVMEHQHSYIDKHQRQGHIFLIASPWWLGPTTC